MRRIPMRLVSVGFIGMVSWSPVFCEDAGSDALFSFQYSALRYSSTKVTDEPKGGNSTIYDSSEFSTTGADSYIWITQGNWNVYLFPFTGGTPVGLSYMANPMLELGGFVGVLQSKTDNRNATSHANIFSPFLTYYLTLNNMTLENYVSLDWAERKEKYTDDTTQVGYESESKEIGYTLQMTAVYPISKNFFFVPSVKYSSLKADNQNVGETTTRVLAITPLALRTSFN